MARRNYAADYEKRYPGTGISEAQKEERGEREAFKAERFSHLRTGRNRGIIVPWIPASMVREEAA